MSRAPRWRHALARVPVYSVAGFLTLIVAMLVIFELPSRPSWISPAAPADPADAEDVSLVALPATSLPPTVQPESTGQQRVVAMPQVTPTPPVSPTSPVTPTPDATPLAASAPVESLDGLPDDTELITYLEPGEGIGANELGRIPILMYHAFVHDEANTDDWTLTFDQFREQLDWLVENDYVMVGMSSIVSRDFDVPAGKKPVVLTFDDSSGGQFRLQASADGGVEVNPDTAVAIMEEYMAMYPEFAGPAFFAVLPDWCFGFPDDNDPSTCEERLQWLIDHGYEIGNHTMEHMNLTDASLADFEYQVHGPTQWFGERISGPNNLTDVLVLPYGAYPAQDDIRALLFDGFEVDGDVFVPTLILEVGASPARSPFHIEWTTNLSRYNTEPTIFWQWAESMSSGETVVYVSDGNVDTVTVPEGWEEALNQDLVAEDGRRIVVETTGQAAA